MLWRLNALNFANKYVLVKRGTNPYGSKKVWVPKTILISFDVGVGSHKTWEHWCIEGDAINLDEHYIGCITIKKILVGGPPWFGDIETSSFGLVTISILLTLFMFISFMFLNWIVLACHGFHAQMQWL